MTGVQTCALPISTVEDAMKAKDQAAEQQQELAKTLESRATSAEAELIAL